MGLLRGIIITLWLFNIAMENGPFIDDFPIKTSIYKGFSMAMLNNQMVYIYIPQTSRNQSYWNYLHQLSLAIERGHHIVVNVMGFDWTLMVLSSGDQ